MLEDGGVQIGRAPLDRLVRGELQERGIVLQFVPLQLRSSLYGRLGNVASHKGHSASDQDGGEPGEGIPIPAEREKVKVGLSGWFACLHAFTLS